MDIGTKNILIESLPAFAKFKGDKDAFDKLFNSADFEETAKALRRERVVFMTEQIRDGKWANIYLTRSGDSVVLTWKYDKIAGEDPDNIHVLGSISEIDFVPDAQKLASTLIVSAKGDGTVRVKLEEGIYYLIQLVFVNEHTQFRENVKVDSTDKVDIVTFHVAIPLADEKKETLRSKSGKSKDPHDTVREKLGRVLTLQEVFDEMDRLAVERINARKISSEEKKRQIESFNSQAEFLKNEMGM